MFYIIENIFSFFIFCQQVNQAIHMNTGQGSYVEANIPWIIGETGYTTKITGQLLLLDATTSLQFRSLVDCETFEVSCVVCI